MAQVKVRGAGRYAPSTAGYGRDEERENIKIQWNLLWSRTSPRRCERRSIEKDYKDSMTNWNFNAVEN